MSPALVGPLVSVAALAAALEDPGLLRWSTAAGTWVVRVTGGSPMTPGTFRAPSIWTSTPTSRRADRSGSTSPTRPGRLRGSGWPTSASGTSTSSSPMTMSAAGWRLDCGGCSTTSATDAVAVLDGGSARGTTAGLPLTTEVPAWPPAALPCGDRWTGVIERDEAAGVPGLGPAARCKGWSPVPRRDRADRCLSGHIPTAISAPTDGEPRGRWALPRHRRIGDALPRARRRWLSRARSSSRAAAAYRRRTTPWRCASPAYRTPILYPGSYSDWTQQGLPVATGDDPGDPPPGAS